MDKQIRFIDSHYNELFRIPDGGKIEITYENGEKHIRECQYIDDYHTKIGNNTGGSKGNKDADKCKFIYVRA